MDIKLLISLFFVFFFIPKLYALRDISCRSKAASPTNFTLLKSDTAKIFSHLSACDPSEWDSENQQILNQLENEYQQAFKSFPIKRIKIRNRNIKKIYTTLKGTKEEISIFKKLLGKNPPKNWMSRIKNCQNILCALDQFTADRESSLRLVLLYKKYGYNFTLEQGIRPPSDPGKKHQGPRGTIWAYLPKLKGESIWTRSELRELSRALSKVPPSMYNLNIKKIVRLPDNYQDSINVGIVGAASNEEYSLFKKIFGAPLPQIYLYDRAHKYDFTRTFIHELAHHYDYSTRTKNNPNNLLHIQSGFAKFSGWQKPFKGAAKSYRLNLSKFCFNDSYQMQDSMEDFADKISYYITYPRLLKDSCLKVYNFMKDKFFKGKEFIKNSYPSLAQIIENYPLSCLEIKNNSKNLSFSKYSQITIPFNVNNQTASHYINIKNFTGLTKNIDALCLQGLKHLFLQNNSNLTCDDLETGRFKKLARLYFYQLQGLHNVNINKVAKNLTQDEIEQLAKLSTVQCRQKAIKLFIQKISKLSAYKKMDFKKSTQFLEQTLFFSFCGNQ